MEKEYDYSGSSNDYFGMDDYESFDQQMGKNSVDNNHIINSGSGFLSEEYKKISLILDKEIEAIVEASQPKGDLIYLSGEDRVRFINEWRENIFFNLNELAKVENSFSSKKFYSKNRAGYYEKRESEIETVKNERSNSIEQLKEEKKSGIGNVKAKKAEKNIGFWDALREKRKIRRNFRNERTTVNSEAKSEIDNLTEGSPKIGENGNTEPDNEHKDKPLRQLYGILEGETDQKGKNTIDPYNDFQLQKKSDSLRFKENEEGQSYPELINVTNYVYFDFLGVQSLNDIIPLLPPRARDSIIDKETTIKDDKFKLYPELKGVTDHKTFNNTVINYLGGTTTNPVTGSSINTTVANVDNEGKVKKAKKEWEKGENEAATKTLEEDYTNLYGLELDFNTYDKEKNKGTYKEVDEAGYVTPEAKRKFIEWLSRHAVDKSIGVIWNNQKREFTAVKQEGKDKESENTGNEKRAKNYNEIISSTATKPWELDTIKRDILVGLSKSLINEQKWQGRMDMTGGNFSEWESAGGPKKDNSIYDIQKNKEEETFKVSKFVETGTYKQTQPKRHSKYDETTGYRKLPEKTDIPNWVNEKINWKVDYKVKIRERTNY